jgi:hypothetical protein
MTIDEALATLRAAGLIANAYQGGNLVSVAGERRDPNDVERRQGVSDVYEFGFRMERVDDGWRFRGNDPFASEELPDLETAVERGLKSYQANRAARGGGS